VALFPTTTKKPALSESDPDSEQREEEGEDESKGGSCKWGYSISTRPALSYPAPDSEQCEEEGEDESKGGVPGALGPRESAGIQRVPAVLPVRPPADVGGGEGGVRGRDTQHPERE
jgi:hypothetical protein